MTVFQSQRTFFILVNSTFCSISSGPTLFVNDFIYGFSVKRGLYVFYKFNRVQKKCKLSELGILLESQSQENTAVMLCLGAIEMNGVVSESRYKGIIGK